MGFQFHGVPDRISHDSGREFNNANIIAEMKSLDKQWDLNTSGHLKSRGAIERLHSSLNDHLRVNHMDKGWVSDEAILRAVAVYNHSNHTAMVLPI